MTETKNLAEALAKLQTRLPKIDKANTAKVETQKGRYSYTYADLADITRELMPILGELGLSFTAKPTLNGDRFVLAYRLLHVSGESEDGQYPLPTGGTPQAAGSAITYARRYCLCAVTGVAPDDDDDGAAAESEARRPAQPEPQWERPAPQQNQPSSAATDWMWAGDFEQKVNASGSVHELEERWEELKVAFKDGRVTETDGNQLKEVIAGRKAELEGASA